jgi:hypothetical protein
MIMVISFKERLLVKMEVTGKLVTTSRRLVCLAGTLEL